MFNKDGEMLIQKRLENKALWPGTWDFSSGGAAIAGENSNKAAERELYEELGIKYDLSSTRPFLTVHFDQGFDDYYIIDLDDETIEDIVIQKSEVKEIRWASYDEIIRLIRSGEMDIVEPFIGMIFSMKNQRGNHLSKC